MTPILISAAMALSLAHAATNRSTSEFRDGSNRVKTVEEIGSRFDSSRSKEAELWRPQSHPDGGRGSQGSQMPHKPHQPADKGQGGRFPIHRHPLPSRRPRDKLKTERPFFRMMFHFRKELFTFTFCSVLLTW